MARRWLGPRWEAGTSIHGCREAEKVERRRALVVTAEKGRGGSISGGGGSGRGRSSAWRRRCWALAWWVATLGLRAAVLERWSKAPTAYAFSKSGGELRASERRPVLRRRPPLPPLLTRGRARRSPHTQHLSPPRLLRWRRKDPSRPPIGSDSRARAPCSAMAFER